MAIIAITFAVVDCGTPSTISNGDVTYSTTTYGADATYTCDDGYNMTNPAEAVRSCGQYGYWSGSLPLCLCKSEYEVLRSYVICVALCYSKITYPE